MLTAFGLQADSATVLRDGRLAVVPAAQLVPGDIVEVSVGGNVPADLRVAERLSATLRWDCRMCISTYKQWAWDAQHWPAALE